MATKNKNGNATHGQDNIRRKIYKTPDNMHAGKDDKKQQQNKNAWGKPKRYKTSIHPDRKCSATSRNRHQKRLSPYNQKTGTSTNE